MTTLPTRRDFLRATIATAAVLGTSGVLLACGDDDDETTAGPGTTAGADLTKVTALMPFPLYLAFISDVAAVSGGFMSDAGIDLDLQFARSAPQALQQLLAGNVDVIRNAPIGIVKAAKEGASILSIGTANQGIIYTLVTEPGSPVESLDQLVGQKVGMATLAGNAEDTLDLILKAAGVDPTQVPREAVGNEATAYALVEEGRIDVLFATREATASIEAAGTDIEVNFLEDTNPLLGTAVVTTTENTTAKRDEMVGYLKGVYDAMQAVLDPATLDELIPEIRADWDLPQLDDAEAVKPVIAGIAQAWVLAGEENVLRNVPERWEQGIEQFKKMKIAPADAVATDYYTNDLIEEALS